MSAFLDTSGLYAMLDADDANHADAARVWTDLVRSGEDLVTTNYVIVETDALVRRRLGLAPARRLHDDVLPLAHVHWITEPTHAAAVAAALAGGRRGPSLVDCASFEVIRALAIDFVFAYDDHFDERGYRRPGATGGASM